VIAAIVSGALLLRLRCFVRSPNVSAGPSLQSHVATPLTVKPRGRLSHRGAVSEEKDDMRSGKPICRDKFRRSFLQSYNFLILKKDPSIFEKSSAIADYESCPEWHSCCLL